MDNTIAIKVEGVSKDFRLPHEKVSSIKSVVVNPLKRKKSYEKQHVLKDISFEIRKGEFFGIVGRNGSGKSTLLKLLAGIYTPTNGSIKVNGKLTPFIELGVGFNPELTGRENIFLNGALLGFNTKEMEAMYQSIVDFAELEKFMDQKLKNYSSGMQVRLAFSIAIRAKSDILLIDEVLAVGDEAFQRKCLDVFETYKAERQTIVLVTHDMETVRKYCTNAIFIDSGKIVYSGEPRMAASKYSESNRETIKADTIKTNKEKKKSKIAIRTSDEENNTKVNFKTGQELYVHVTWPKDLQPTNIGVAIIKKSGEYIFGANTLYKNIDISSGSAEYKVKLMLEPGKYYLSASISGPLPRNKLIDMLEFGPEFIIEGEDDKNQGGITRLEHEWITN
jgi:ABC-2 type transport system ATP-binding protein